MKLDSALREQIGVLDKAVAETGFVDDQFTFADINLLPILYRVRQFREVQGPWPGRHTLPAISTGTLHDRASGVPRRRRPPAPRKPWLEQASLPSSFEIPPGSVTLLRMAP